MCEGDLLHGRANGARLSVDGAARPRRGPHCRQPHPKPSHSQNVCGAGGARNRRGFCVVARGHRDSQAVSPFFRIPGLLRQKSVEQYLAAHGDMTWSADFLADDWTRINNSEVARRAISRIEARGKGILLLHDIHARTVLALPEILNELKSRGYKI